MFSVCRKIKTLTSNCFVPGPGLPGLHSHPLKSGNKGKGKKKASKPTTNPTMATHHADLTLCRKMVGNTVARVCEHCDGKCVICDSFVRPKIIVTICDDCNYGSLQGKCVICGRKGESDAYYCEECVQMEKDRDGCPRVTNVGASKTDLFYERKKYGFKKR